MSFQPDNNSLREINDQDIDTLMELTGNPDVIFKFEKFDSESKIHIEKLTI